MTRPRGGYGHTDKAPREDAIEKITQERQERKDRQGIWDYWDTQGSEEKGGSGG